MKLFSGTASTSLSQKVAKSLGISLSKVEEHVFSDGEKRIRIGEKVVGEHCFVIQSANTPVDTNYMELFFLVDALKRSGAEFVTAIVPYFGYQRQDHIFQDGEAVSLEVIIKILENIGVDNLMSFDMHSVRIPDLFTIPVTALSALPLFANHISEKLRGSVASQFSSDIVLVSPDKGGIARIKKVSELLGNMDFVSLIKDRDVVTGEIVMKGIDGSLQGKKKAILIDDMLASGKTTLLAAQMLQEAGIEEMYAFATHAIFSEDAPQRLEKSPIKKIIVTDTVDIPKNKQFPKLAILSVSDIIAKAIKK